MQEIATESSHMQHTHVRAILEKNMLARGVFLQDTKALLNIVGYSENLNKCPYFQYPFSVNI